MNNRVTIPLLAVAAIAFACGPRTRPEPTSSNPRNTSEFTAGLATSLDVSVDSRVSLSLHVTNATDKRIEIRFPSGQTHDFAVFDASGRELWRWSTERMFTQALQNKLLGARETVTYAERWEPAGQRGTFTAVGTLTSTSHPVSDTVTFTLP